MENKNNNNENKSRFTHLVAKVRTVMLRIQCKKYEIFDVIGNLRLIIKIFCQEGMHWLANDFLSIKS